MGRTKFDKDTAGIAVISEFSDRVEVTFEEEYEEAPVVTAVLLADSKEEAFLHEQLEYAVIEVTGKSFAIVINQYAASELKFSWMALAVGEVKETVGSSEVKEAVDNFTSEVQDEDTSEVDELEASPSAEASGSGEKKE